MQEDKNQEHEKRLEALSKPKKPTEKYMESSFQDGRYIFIILVALMLIIMINGYTKDLSVQLSKPYRGRVYSEL